jgi:hypothetical protein
MEKADPLFHTYASVPATAQMSVVVRSLFWDFVQSAPRDQQLRTAEIFLETVQAEVDDLRKKLNPLASDESIDEQPGETLNQQEPSPAPTAASAPPSSEPETASSSEVRPLFCEPETASSSEPNPFFWRVGGPQRVEIIGKPFNVFTGSLLSEESDDDEESVDSLAVAR